MMIVRQANERYVHQGAMFQVERPVRVVAHAPRCFPLSFFDSQVRQINKFYTRFRGRCDELSGFAARLAEASTQDFMPSHDLGETPLQRADTQRTLQTNRQGYVVDRG